MSHITYALIVRAIRNGNLKEPFSEFDFRRSCPNLPEGTYKAFLHKHTKDNPGKNSPLFIRVSPGQFKCLRPFKYDL